MIEKIKEWKANHPDLFEFIMFNLLSNIATITNFLVLWLSTPMFVNLFGTTDFNWFIFKYDETAKGLAGFCAFLLAYVCAQIVNFFVQRKLVFGSNSNISKAIPWYVLTVTVAGIISIWLPPYVISFTEPFVGALAPTVANIVNIFLQVVINYPMMKFVIMKKD
ncbi:MAG: polysaccharide biosynthesis protein GtrA [Lachnospirales bacterium]